MSIPIGSLEKPHWWNGMHEVSESSEYVQSQKCKWINKNQFFPLFYCENIAWHFYLWKNFMLNFCSTLRMWSYFYKTDFHICSSSYEICFIFGFLKYNRKSMSLLYHWMKIHLVAINQKSKSEKNHGTLNVKWQRPFVGANCNSKYKNINFFQSWNLPFEE